MTDIYFRRYTPVGITDSYSGTVPPGVVTSDLYQQQELSFDFTGGACPHGTDTFELQLGTVTTVPIAFNTDPATTAANIETALVNAGFTTASVSPDPSSTAADSSFDVTFGQAPSYSQVQYVATTDTPLPTTPCLATPRRQSFTGVRFLTNPTQQLVFESTATGPVTGTFELQLGSVLTGAIALTAPTCPAPRQHSNGADERRLWRGFSLRPPP